MAAHVFVFFLNAVVAEEAMMDVLDEGLQNRRVAAHGMNDRSSRGHTIMTIEADSFVKDTDCSNLSTEIKNPEMLPRW